MTSCGRRGGMSRHGGKRRGVNRYNPSSPDYNAVHHSWWHRAILGPANGSNETGRGIAKVYVAKEFLGAASTIIITEDI